MMVVLEAFRPPGTENIVNVDYAILGDQRKLIVMNTATIP